MDREEQISELASLCGCDYESINKGIENIQTKMWITELYVDRIPTAKERTEVLESVMKSIAGIEYFFNVFPDHTTYEVLREFHSRTRPEEKWEDSSDYPCTELLGLLVILKNSVEATINKSVTRRLNPKKESIDAVIKEAADLWTTLTGRRASFTTSWSNGKRGGDFISFLTSIGTILNLDPAPLPERFVRLKKQDPDL